MALFRVECKEVYNTIYLVDAENENQAKELTRIGQANELESYYYCDVEDYVKTDLVAYLDYDENV